MLLLQAGRKGDKKIPVPRLWEKPNARPDDEPGRDVRCCGADLTESRREGEAGAPPDKNAASWLFYR